MIAYAQMPLMNAHTDISSEVGGSKFGLSLHIHPYFVYASSEDSAESVHKRRHA